LLARETRLSEELKSC